jgi:tocopherol cyclase
MKINHLNNLVNFQETPHSGYHGDRSNKRFFEGWYFRVTLPKIQENFAFMYSIDDPSGNNYHSGGAVQIIGINEKYLYRTFPNVNKFWAAVDCLALTHWGKTSLEQKPRILNSKDFHQYIQEGYQVTTTLNQGFIHNPSNNQYCRWEYKTKPIYSWGDLNKSPQATAGLLSFFPIFEPGWQVLMAYGLATGYIDWNGKIYQFNNVPAYSEKNWGCSFPNQWFWINCNSFQDETDLAVTAAGGTRKVLWWFEEVAIIGIHFQGKFYEFASSNSQINSEVKSWGKWEIKAYNDFYQVKLLGTTNIEGTYVRVPTEKGLVFSCRDTLKGQLTLELKYRNGKTIVQANSNLCGLEIGKT